MQDWLTQLLHLQKNCVQKNIDSFQDKSSNSKTFYGKSGSAFPLSMTDMKPSKRQNHENNNDTSDFRTTRPQCLSYYKNVKNQAVFFF